ncbi:hypothetical protein CLU79DRAFT_754616 [Phycomyces nitens]|nr:hypothetical protein CLU79DRAFT_754616 [Phycomyces nitens]
MQQQIQIRTTSITLLTRATALCRKWAQYQTTSRSLLGSLGNILSQRLASQDQHSKVAEMGADPMRLFYKQTIAMEDTMVQIYQIMNDFEDVIHDWQRLESDATKHFQKYISTLSNIPDKPAPLSNEALIQVAAIKPEEIHDHIGDLHSMYLAEYNYKQVLLDTLPMHTSRTELLDQLTDRWARQTHIQLDIPQEMEERLKLYKTIKKTVESVD